MLNNQLSNNNYLPLNNIIILFCIIFGSTIFYIHIDKKKHINENDYKYTDTVIDKLKKIIQNQNIIDRKIDIANRRSYEDNINHNQNIIDRNIDIANRRVYENNINDRNIDIANRRAYENNINHDEEIIDRKNNIANRRAHENNINHDEEIIDRRIYLNNRDKRVLEDNFYPPERRASEYQYPVKDTKKYWNIPTNGYPENYQLLGLVLRNNTETAYNLFGRQTFPRSNQYEYYVEGVMNNMQVKIPIKIKGGKEIVDNQEVHIEGTNHPKGSFIVKLYDYDLPKYNPYIY